MPGDAEILGLFEALALDAGRAIMDVYDTGFAVEHKADASPVTEADKRAEAIILAGLRERYRGIACIGEEEMAAGLAPDHGGGDFILVDPLDGTREFLGRKSDFTVNIALVRDGQPVVGVVFAPAAGTIYAGRPGLAEAGEVSKAFRVERRRPIGVRGRPATPVIVASRSHRTPETDAFIADYPGAETRAIGSSLKFCLLAAGEADLYPRFGRTMQWDTAAGDAVLRSAGGMTTTLDGTPLRYGRDAGADGDPFANPWFIASAERAGDHLPF